MTPECKDCFRVRKSSSAYKADGDTLHCGLRRVARPLCEVMRGEGKECGPEGKRFAPRHGEAA